VISHKIARKFNYNVTFVPKPFPNRNGSGMHFHISVVNNKKNLFYSDKNDKNYNLSDNALSFLQ